MIKKIFLICIICAAVSFIIPQIHAFRLRSATREGLVANDVRCARLTDELSGVEGVWEAAVLQRGGAVLIGVRCKSENRDEVCIKTQRLAKDYFPTCTRVVGVEDETSLEITQLAHLLQSDLPKDVLNSRFRYLANKKNSLFDKM